MRRNARGFTLIELMVVVVIVGMITTFAVLAIGVTGRDSSIEQESERLDALIRYTREQAELANREYGLRFESGTYEFLVYDARREEWRAVEEDDALRLRTLSPGLSFALFLEGRPIVLRRPVDEKTPKPQIMLMSNGDVTPFELRLTRAGTPRIAVLRSDEDQQVLLVPESEVKK